IESLKKAPFEAVFEQDSKSLLTLARMRKDEDEIARIKDVGRRAQEVFARVVEFLSSCNSDKEGVLKKDGEIVTVGLIKRLIRMWADELDLDTSAEEVIFAQGYDAAVPHSRGADEAAIRVGETIVFDFCPCERGGGYFFDMTRTFCVGEVRDEVALVWRRVLEVQTQVLAQLEVGRPACEFDEMCSSMFEEWGYPTLRKKPGTSSGYVHGLGHGVGLQIHEMPYLSALRGDKTPLAAGHVFTVEPGLYFPDKRFGVRLEDVVAIHGDGTIENLTPFSKEILVPLKGRPVKTA
ncbi:MAG: aminopeptidase P family protein, partial [Planctomycetota bacterium]